MNKPVASCCVVFALLLGCGNDDTRVGDLQPSADVPASPADAPTGEMDCRAEDSLAYSIDTAFSSAAANRVPFRCLRFADGIPSPSGSRDFHLVNIDTDSGDRSLPADQLQIPLHEVKTKGFLKGRKLIIVSDGKRFGAIERECDAIRAAGIVDVLALLDGKENPQAHARISAREFVAERPYGAWYFVNHSSEPKLTSPLFAEAAAVQPGVSEALRRRGSAGLVRTLVIFDSNEQEALSAPREDLPFSGQVFVLDGGLAALEAYQARAEAMAEAKARPRIGERGCRG